MSIIGGALIPLAQGFVADISTISISFVVNIVCFAVVLGYATGKMREYKANLQN
jgi:FHS family L-fucose permease-like MFS transporter